MSDAQGPARPDVVARREGSLGHITLNRPAALNALTLGMVEAVDAALDAWERDPQVAVLLLDGAGDRAFCAGGDIRALSEAAAAGRHEVLTDFFRTEYRLNARLARFGKPIVAAMDGLTMGGGIGLGAHVAHRVVTERSVLAMPEVRIGFAPDVGGTYLLARAPGALGLHLALTGGRLTAADAMLCGLADVALPHGALHELRIGLALCRDGEAAAACLRTLAVALPEGPLAAARGWVDRCYAADSVAEILQALESAPEPEARAAAAEIAGNAPTSLAVTLQALRAARHLSLEDCLEMEFRISCSITRRPDFVEGVRAAVVDKDRDPRWRPGRLGEVAREDVMQHLLFPGPGLGLARPR